MKLGDLILFYPSAFISILTKTIRTNIDENTKQYIEENHLYHCSSKENIDTILDTGYLKPATGLLKNVTSYGKSCCFMFAGLPELDSFIKNMSVNPYLEPTKIQHAVEFDIKKEELNNYKIRPFSDEAIIYEGYCVFPQNRVKPVELVTDLKKDNNGNIIGLCVRKRTEQEINKSPDKYIPSKEYMKYISERKKELGYIDIDNKVVDLYNSASSIFSGAKLETNTAVKNTKKNFFTYINNFKNKFFNHQKLLTENPEQRLNHMLDERNFFNRKNPYADSKFAITISNLQKQGITQDNINDILPKFVNSKYGAFLRDKYNSLDDKPLKSGENYGIKHSNRVCLLSMLIAQNENLIPENSSREMDLLVTSAYYHDIGQISKLKLSSKRSSKKIDKIDLHYLDGKKFSNKDKQIVKLLVEGHNYDEKNFDKLVSKYNIENDDIQMVNKLCKILNDANILDNSRFTINTPHLNKTHIDDNLLQYDSSKKLLETSFAIESLTQNIPIKYILNYKNEKTNENYYIKKSFNDSLKVNIKPQINKNIQEKSDIQKDIR